MKISLLVASIFIAFSLSASAQSIEQRKTDSVFQLVKRYFNTKQADSIYALAGDGFRKEISAETFNYVMNNQLFPAGQIQESSLMSFLNNKLGTYKLTFSSGSADLLLSLDDQDKIDYLQFKPHEAEAANKPQPVATTNLLRTLTDKNVDTAARRYIQKANTVGLSIGILKNGVVSAYNYGETARGDHKLPNANSLYEIGSITKTFTAALLAYYVSEGKVKLTDPIIKYLPDSVAANKDLQAITLQMLSNHTSGLPTLPANFADHSSSTEDPYRDYTKQYLFEYLKTCKPSGQPGGHYAYSNMAVGLLGTILEQVSGKSYEQMVEEIICKPLGLKSTAQNLSPALAQRFVKVYNDSGKETSPWHFDALAACGALKSTVNNLLTYAKANIEPSDTKLSKAFQLTHQVTYTQKDLKLGLAWHIIIINNIEYYFHNGDTYGCSSFLVFNPEKKLAVVILSNCGASVDELGADIVKKIQ